MSTKYLEEYEVPVGKRVVRYTIGSGRFMESARYDSYDASEFFVMCGGCVVKSGLSIGNARTYIYDSIIDECKQSISKAEAAIKESQHTLELLGPDCWNLSRFQKREPCTSASNGDSVGTSAQSGVST